MESNDVIRNDFFKLFFKGVNYCWKKETELEFKRATRIFYNLYLVKGMCLTVQKNK